jgi:hypothetical protein
MNDRGEDRDSKRADNQPREPYVPPRIKRIQLSVDEALMSICKSGLGAGPLGPGCFGDLQGSCMGGGS